MDAVTVRESECIKIGVDTGAGKTAWPQSATYGKRSRGDVDLTFRTATGELVNSGRRLCVEGCDHWRVNPRVRGVQATVCKQLLSVGKHIMMGGVAVMYGDKGYLFHKGSNVAKKIEAWIQKEISSSQHHGSTLANKEDHVYTIYMKPKGNETGGSPLSQSSVGLPVGYHWRLQRIQRIQEEQTVQTQEEQGERTMIQCEMRRWMVKS